MNAHRGLWLVALLALVACAHAPHSTGLPGLKPVCEDFLQRIRWRDYRGAANTILPERREAFLAARKAQHDERDLTITDYDLEDAKLGADDTHAKVVTKVSWVRLPSPTENTDTITLEFLFKDRAWWLARMDEGPFVPELSAPVSP
jgi:hypothetical protein